MIYHTRPSWCLKVLNHRIYFLSIIYGIIFPFNTSTQTWIGNTDHMKKLILMEHWIQLVSRKAKGKKRTKFNMNWYILTKNILKFITSHYLQQGNSFLRSIARFCHTGPFMIGKLEVHAIFISGIQEKKLLHIV